MATTFTVKILRKYPNAKCTSGYLAVNNKIICYTLERPWADNMQNISAVPPGRYPAIIRYDHTDHWRIELKNVPGRTNVQIHVGNQVDDSKGCILVGLDLGADLCSLGRSRDAYAALKQSFYGSATPTSSPDLNIQVEIE